MNENVKIFDTTAKRPVVLLLGNGLVYNQSVGWKELIKLVSKDGICTEKYYDKTNKKYLLPNTVLSEVTSVLDDNERHKKYKAVFSDKSTPNENIRKLLSLSFDAVLTTNYTYEIEASADDLYPGYSDNKKRKFAKTTFDPDNRRYDAKYLLRTFNRMNESDKDIWHIHGELRRPSSMILSHDEYARFISKILEYSTERGNEYEKYRNELKFKSWIDYFILGDIYIVGLGVDYSEFDLWWLLGRRLREKSGTGKTVFYEPESKDNNIKQTALRDMGVDVQNLGFNSDSPGFEYSVFYNAIVEKISEQV